MAKDDHGLVLEKWAQKVKEQEKQAQIEIAMAKGGYISGIDPTEESFSSLDSAYELLQYATELLVADVLDKGTFIKIKHLIDSMDCQNHNMARKIMDAKAEK